MDMNLFLSSAVWSKTALKTCAEFAEAFVHTTKAPPEVVVNYTRNIGVLVSYFYRLLIQHRCGREESEEHVYSVQSVVQRSVWRGNE